MDQCPIEGTKRLYRKELITTPSTEGNEETSLIDLIKRMDIVDVIKMSAKAWREVKNKAIKKTWKKIGVCSKTEGPTQDDDEEDVEDPVADFRNIIAQLPVSHDHPLKTMLSAPITERKQCSPVTDSKFLQWVRVRNSHCFRLCLTSK